MLKLFESLTGNPPFPWQERLYGLFEQDQIPGSLDIATGLGKTSVIAIWLLARAAGAPVPRRLVYVVDRRAVIDQSTQVAEELRSWVLNNSEVCQKLGIQKNKLPISTLRGQHADNREWLEDPSAAAIIVGTVDLVGSRLLFEGYRCSRKMRSYHAGLLGTDCLFVLDEAHLVPCFEQLLKRIVLQGQDFAPRPEARLAQLPPNKLLSLSATSRGTELDSFGLDHDDLKHNVVRQRLDARKRLSIQLLQEDKEGKSEELAERIAEEAWALSKEGSLPIRCLVFTNKRDDAEKALKHLKQLAKLNKLKKGEAPAADVELLVGGRRIFERTESAKRLEELGFLAGTSSHESRPAFLFATSAGEVGIDLDADHMVCDLVEWERMIQRLGRVNRRGKGDATVIVLRTEPKPTKKQKEAILEINKGVNQEHNPELSKKQQKKRETNLKLSAEYEQRLSTWRMLSLPFTHLPSLNCALDASPGALRDLQRRARKDHALEKVLLDASSTPPLYPLLDRPTLESWSMTSLPDHQGRPSVAPWLRGWIKDFPQTTVVWREHLPLEEAGGPLKERELKRFFDSAPPHLSELLETDSKKVLDWLGKRCAMAVKGLAKKSSFSEMGQALRTQSVVAFTVDRSGDAVSWTLGQLTFKPKTQMCTKELARYKELAGQLSGATLVLDARLGGLTEGLLDPKATELPAVADTGWPNEKASDTPRVPYRVRHLVEASAVDPDKTEDGESWRERERFVIARSADGEAIKWLVVEKRYNDAATEDDRSAGRPQLLDEHQAWTAIRAEKLASRLGISEKARKLLALAGRLHDEGKRGPPWQSAFSAPSDGDYAKTLGPVNVHALAGYRHEFGSLPYAEQDDEVASLSPEDRDLVLHLIASHHGHARPNISAHGDNSMPPSALEERAKQVALRFARLEREWGPWGLAWWESLLRAADAQASRDNDEMNKKGNGKS